MEVGGEILRNLKSGAPYYSVPKSRATERIQRGAREDDEAPCERTIFMV